MNQFKKMTSLMLICSMLSISLTMQSAHAGMIGTDVVLARQESTVLRQKISSFLDRDEVAAEMQKLGVDTTSAKLRVGAMTDNELQQIAGKLDQMPAGGESILGVLFTVFIILLITDILGFTKVFPFTKPIR
jgi:uncharacterized protein YjbJ (UPF0337 family)